MKFLKWFLIVVVVIMALFFFVVGPIMKSQTKKHSPQKTAVYTQNDMDLSVSYSSPFKKGRDIFGALVPYGQTWRTGANEPTTFVTGSDVSIMGQSLPSGTYSIWTVPNADTWTIYINSKVPDWGVSMTTDGMKPSHNAKHDAVTVSVPVERLASPLENFTIDFEEKETVHLTLAWDTVKVSVPIRN